MKTPDFRHRLRSLRLHAGLTCNELARQAGLGEGYVSLLENGKRQPTLATLRKLAHALGEKSLACWD